MSDTSNQTPPVGQAPITIHGQYIKDLSFENPRAPQSLQLTAPPQYSLNVRCDARNLEQPGMFEVTMTVELDGKDQQSQPIFVMELVYAGVVSVGNMPQEAIGPVIGIHVPMLLFPFARAIVTATLSQAALPPLLLQPVDFAALYQQQMAQAGNSPVGHA